MKKKKLLIFLAILFSFAITQGQNVLVINLKDNPSVSFPFKTIQKIAFDSDNMLLQTKNGAENIYILDEIISFSFLNEVGIKEVKEEVEIKTFNHIKNGNVVEIPITEIDSITFSNFSIPNTLDGVLINGVIWASCNVDMPGTFASQPNEAGMFYQWNRKIGWSSTEPMVNSDGGIEWDSSIPGDIWEPENNMCPIGWRLPTHEEQQSLINSGSFWGELDGVYGRYFGSSSDKRVFFPAVGYRNYETGIIYDKGKYSLCWSGEFKPVRVFACSIRLVFRQ